MKSLFSFFFLISTAIADLCQYCGCDFSTESVTCSDKDFLLRTVSLLPSISQLVLHRIPLPHAPHFLYHTNLRILKINDCGLEGLSAHSILPLPNLEVISFANNKLTTLPATLFRRQDDLKVIDVSYNKISDLSGIEWILGENVLLDALDLGHNPIEMSTRSTKLPPVRQLLMSMTNIERINGTSIIFKATDRCKVDGCRVLPFPRTESLTYFDVADNGAVIEASALQALLNATHLNFANSKLPAEFFDWLETAAVIHLNLSNAQITVPNEEWRWCGPRLETLDISNIHLRRLRLNRGCVLRKIFAKENQLEMAFLDTPTLEAVYLDKNLFSDWPMLPMGTSLDRLETFSISSNLLTTLPPGALTHFPILQHLDLSRNQLSKVDFDAFPTLGMQLISIDLSYNQLSVLPHPVLPSILFFDVSSNNINEMSPFLFAGMPLLQHLKLSNNPLIFRNCSEKCWLDHLDILTNLVDLDLSNCQLNRTLDLSKQMSLKSVILRGNQLTAIDGRHFPSSLSMLDAGENLIHYVKNLTSHSNLRELRLDGNPLICDCSLFEIRSQLFNQTKINDPQSYYCFSSSWQYPLLPYLSTLKPCILNSASSLLPTIATAFLITLCIIFLIVVSILGGQRACSSISHNYKRLAAELPVRL
ncbi:unnamed protein product, partial [Mesorhabditis belari]|uniref:LRRCT domain-containing protein n=1 Tax=Mesorhabditis belari TaxID=2138241 RepID=A0AAF3E8T2_9BILA